MVEVTATKRYIDLQRNETMQKGQTFTVTNERSEELAGLGLVSVVRTIEETVEAVETPKAKKAVVKEVETKKAVKKSVKKSVAKEKKQTKRKYKGAK